MSTSLAPVAMPYGDMTEASLNGDVVDCINEGASSISTLPLLEEYCFLYSDNYL